METLWAIKSAKFPLASLLSLQLCTLDTADFLNNVELGAPSTSAFFHTDLMALLIWLETIASPVDVIKTQLSGPVLEAVIFKRTSLRKTSIQLFNFAEKTILAGPWVLTVLWFFTRTTNSSLSFVILSYSATVMFARAPALLALSIDISTRRKSRIKVYWAWVIWMLCAPDSWPNKHTTSLAALLVSNRFIWSGVIKAWKSSSIFSHCRLAQFWRNDDDHRPTLSLKEITVSLEMVSPTCPVRE